jgi:predicted nucleic acid-binding protein
MILCLDTNVLIQARARSHPYGVLLDGFAFGLMHLAVSNRVLTEYAEIIIDKAGVQSWATVSRF